MTCAKRTLAALITLGIGSSAAWAIPSAKAAGTIGGLKGAPLTIDKRIASSVSALSSNAGYGGMFATLVKVAPKDLQTITKSKPKMASFIAAATNYTEGGGIVTNMQLTAVPRGTLYGAVLKAQTQYGGDATWATTSRKPFELALRQVVPAMLKDKSANLLHWSGNPQDDWSAEGWIAVSKKSGKVFSLVLDGDM